VDGARVVTTIGKLRAQLRDSLGVFAVVVRRRDLRLLLSAHGIVSIGMWAGSVAVTVYSFGIAGPGGVALQTVMALLPAAVAVPFVSVLADRFPRARVIVCAGLLRVAIFGLMAVLVIVGAPLVVVLLCSSAGCIVQGAIDPARQALLPQLAARPEDLTAANVASSSIDSVSIFVGPALGGLLLAVTSVQFVIGVGAVLLLIAVALVSRISVASPADARDDQPKEPFAQRVSAGARTVAGSPALRLIVGFMAAQTMVDGLLGVLLAAVALDLLGVGESGLGVLNSAIGLGAVAGAAAAVMLVGRRRLAPSFAIGCALWGAPIALIGLVPETAVAMLALAAVGLGNTLIDVSGYTLLQRAAPEEVLGRVFGVLESFLLTSIAIGAVLAPVLIEVLGLRGALVATGLFLPVLVGLGWGALRQLDALVGAQVPVADMDLLRGVPMLAALGGPELERLAGALRPLHLSAGDDAVVQGEPGQDFYIVVAGRLEVLVDGVRVREHEAGDAFGEIALLRDIPRTATVRALEDAELRVLGRDEFLAAVTGHADSARAAHAVATSRLSWAQPVARVG
jgi:MFS family permease